MKSHKEFSSALTELGERIYHRRVLKNLATKEIAHQIHLTPEAFRNIEKGITDPSFTTLLRITEVLKINVSELVKGI
jgi:transcriptional regulator with XRE-family HTH domain